MSLSQDMSPVVPDNPAPADMTNLELAQVLLRAIHGDDGAWLPQCVAKDGEAFRPGSSWVFQLSPFMHQANQLILKVSVVDNWTLEVSFELNGAYLGPRRKMQVFSRPPGAQQG